MSEIERYTGAAAHSLQYVSTRDPLSGPSQERQLARALDFVCKQQSAIVPLREQNDGPRRQVLLLSRDQLRRRAREETQGIALSTNPTDRNTAPVARRDDRALRHLAADAQH